ncbi:hypothetical protein DV515_00003872 [Chloebia gouldiae]|uniref:Uncharacterized protein n=1 Tax=Chloebia gouldiae TaxID=44316 RepID=A0A3L8SSV4_CHLGU|nr:hypothetical protein DV515_00003872 [Chloebia gouldiae]
MAAGRPGGRARRAQPRARAAPEEPRRAGAGARPARGGLRRPRGAKRRRQATGRRPLPGPAEACYVFSRLWLRWVHFKLPNRRQCSSKLGQMESGRHSRDDSGSRWALPLSAFVLRGEREDTELTSSGRPPLLYMDGDGMNGDTKAKTK